MLASGGARREMLFESFPGSSLVVMNIEDGRVRWSLSLSSLQEERRCGTSAGV